MAVSVKDHPDQKVILTPSMKLIYMSAVAAKSPAVTENPFRIVPHVGGPGEPQSTGDRLDPQQT